MDPPQPLTPPTAITEIGALIDVHPEWDQVGWYVGRGIAEAAIGIPDRTSRDEVDVIGARPTSTNQGLKGLRGDAMSIDIRPGAGQDLRYVDLRGASLIGANLSGANLSGANLSGADFSWADLARAEIEGVTGPAVVLRRAILYRARVSGNLNGADLSRCWAVDADFRNSTLASANLTGAYMPGARLAAVDLAGADLTGAILDADLRGADLRGADLRGADLEDADLEGADLTYADLAQKGAEK